MNSEPAAKQWGCPVTTINLGTVMRGEASKQWGVFVPFGVKVATQYGVERLEAKQAARVRDTK